MLIHFVLAHSNDLTCLMCSDLCFTCSLWRTHSAYFKRSSDAALRSYSSMQLFDHESQVQLIKLVYSTTFHITVSLELYACLAGSTPYSNVRDSPLLCVIQQHDLLSR